MIKANELRIGNYLEKYLEPSISEWIEIETTSIDINFISRKEKHGYRPIQLTEEWLVKFGFVKTKRGVRKNLSLFECFHYHIDTENMFYSSASDYITMRKIKHVHQLQNLYFALTGQELEIKE